MENAQELELLINDVKAYMEALAMSGHDLANVMFLLVESDHTARVSVAKKALESIAVDVRNTLESLDHLVGRL